MTKDKSVTKAELEKRIRLGLLRLCKPALACSMCNGIRRVLTGEKLSE